MRNAYDTLGLQPDASGDQINEAFRRHAKCLHPDVNKRPTAEAEFKKLNEAYDILRDDDKRRQHDYALAKIAAKDLPDDAVDTALDEYSLEPKKKKKKKRKKEREAQVVQQVIHHHYHAPTAYPEQQYAPPQVETQPGGYGQADYAPIPDGYDPDDSLGGLV